MYMSYPDKKKGCVMQAISNTSPSFQGFDYIPCLMSKKQIELAEKVFHSVEKSDIFQKADECMVDMVAMPAKDNSIMIDFHNFYNDSYANKNNNLLKTTFRPTDTKAGFIKKEKKVLAELCDYLTELLNINTIVKTEKRGN